MLPSLGPTLAALIGPGSEQGEGAAPAGRGAGEGPAARTLPSHLEGTALAAMAGERSSLQS